MLVERLRRKILMSCQTLFKTRKSHDKSHDAEYWSYVEAWTWALERWALSIECVLSQCAWTPASARQAKAARSQSSKLYALQKGLRPGYVVISWIILLLSTLLFRTSGRWESYSSLYIFEILVSCAWIEIETSININTSFHFFCISSKGQFGL